MKKLTLPLSALLVGYFRFQPGSMTPSLWVPKKGIKVGDFDLSICTVQPCDEENDYYDQYRVFFNDGSNLKFRKDESITIQA